jgi:signal transduction histidine kinase
MLEYARRRLKQLKDEFDPSTAALGRWLAIVNVCIVLVAVGGVSIYAVDMLRTQADAQGKARALLIGAGAREQLRRVDETTLATAIAEYPRSAQRRAFIANLLTDRLSAGPGEQDGVAVRLLPYSVFSSAPVDDFTSLHSAALADGHSAVQRIPKLDIYAASLPIFSSRGDVLAMIEARLPATEIDRATNQLVRRLVLTAIVLGLIAVLGGMILGELVAGPVRALTRAAVRLGQGDFSTSIPPRGPAEVGVLASTMEDMRRNLVDLTGALRRHEAEAQSVLAGIVEGVYAVDKSRVIRYLNPQAARLLGVKPEDAVGRFCGDVLKPCAEHGRRPCEFNCPILHARLEGRSQAVERLQARGNEARTTVITSSGMVEGLQVQVIRDETELEAVRRARDSVLANISHEFRTPLAAQLASIELLREGLNTMPLEQQHELVWSLERGTLRLTQLIDNLLESVRIESGQLAIRRQSVDLAAVADDARALLGALLAQRNQRLLIEISRELPQVEGDAARLTQVLVNLIANASKFAPEGSTILIGAEVRNGSMAWWVEDEGPGLPEGDAISIFDRFRRGPAEEPEPGGLGLGLWIVKSIIDRHGGTIVAERTDQNRTRFTMTLPVESQS